MSKSAEAANPIYPPIDSVEAMNNELGEGVPSEAGASPYASDSKPVTGDLVAVTASNHSRRVYRVDENGKKRAISQDAVMELYGKADDYQGKRPRSSSLKTQRKSAIDGGIKQLNFERAGIIGTDEDSITDISAINTTIETKPETAKSSHRLERARQVGKVAIGGAEKLVVAGAALDKRVGAWVVQRAHNPGVQDKLAGVRQKSKDVVASANTQLEKAKAKKSALWARIHERRTELSKNTHNFGEKTTDVFNRHRFTAGVLAGALLVGVAVMATSGSDSNEHAKDRTITGSVPQHDTNKLGGSIFDPPNLFTKAAPETAVATQPKVEDNLGAAKKRMAEINETPAKEAAPPTYKKMVVNKGNRLWTVLQNADIPEGQIMQRLDAAAKASGLKYEWHGSGTHKWIKVNGHSDTKSVINYLDKFIQR